MSRAVKYNRSENAAREYRAHSYRSVMGRSSCIIECGFCGTETRAYVWSLAGGGKKCSNPACGALHCSYGYSMPIEGREDMRP